MPSSRSFSPDIDSDVSECTCKSMMLGISPEMDALEHHLCEDGDVLVLQKYPHQLESHHQCGKMVQQSQLESLQCECMMLRSQIQCGHPLNCQRLSISCSATSFCSLS